MLSMDDKGTACDRWSHWLAASITCHLDGMEVDEGQMHRFSAGAAVSTEVGNVASDF